MQPSFFDYAMDYQGGRKSMKFLGEMKELIPFDHLEKQLIEKGIYKSKRKKDENGKVISNQTNGEDVTYTSKQEENTMAIKSILQPNLIKYILLYYTTSS